MNGLLKAEFIKLKNENVISEETFSKIIEYYEQKEIYELGLVQDAKETLASIISENKPKVPENKIPAVKPVVESVKENKIEPAKEKKPVNITMLLSIVASLLIGGGIISLIAYNWNAISRLTKSIVAFIICNAAPLLYVILTKLRKKPFEQKSKEFFALLWALLFGGSIAFISQTYRMPSNPVTFLIIWIAVSIGITYSLRSFATFFFSLFLLIVYPVYAQQFAYSTAVAFYPAMFLLYFFAKENKKCFYIWLVELIGLIGVVFERRLPGLWIIAYVSSDVLLLNYAEKNDDKFCKRVGIILSIILGMLLAIPYFWENIGFLSYRNNPKYKMYGSVCDYIVTLALYIGSLITVVPSIIQKIKKQKCQNATKKIIEFLFLIAVGASYFAASFINDFAIFVPRIFLAIYLSLFMLFVLSDKIKKSAFCLFAIFYVILSGRINFVFILIFAMAIVAEFLLRKINLNYESKIPVVAAFIFLICERIYYVFAENIFRFQIENIHTLTTDACIACVFLVSVICLISFKDIKAKNWNKNTIISQITFYSSILLATILHLVYEYSNLDLEILFDLAFTILAVMSAVNFILTKSKSSYLGIVAFILNFIISCRSSYSFLFFFTMLFIVLFAIDYYSQQLMTDNDSAKYVYYGLYFTVILIGYVLRMNNIAEVVPFNPFNNVRSGILYLTAMALTFVIPLVSIIKSRKLCRVSPIAIAALSFLFLTFNSYVKVFTPSLFIFTVCLMNLVAGCIDIILLKKKETLITVFASFLTYYLQVINGENYLNGIALFALAIFAFYAYSKYYLQDEKLVQNIAACLYSVVLFVLLCFDGEGELLNYGDSLFSSAEKIISSVLILPALVGVPAYLIIKEKRFIPISHICITAVLGLYFIFGSYVKLFVPEKLGIVLCFLVAISSFIDVFVLRLKKNIGLFVLSLFEFYRLLLQDYHAEFFIVILPLLVFALLVYTKNLIGEKKFINKLVSFIFSIMLIITMEYSFYYPVHSVMFLTKIELILSIGILVLFLFIIPVQLVCEKEYEVNYAIILYCLLLIVTFVIYLIYKRNVSEFYKRCYEVLMMLLIFAFALLGLYKSYIKSSIKSANYYLIFLCIGFLIRFFMMSKELVERGVVCIACGVCILIMNLVFSKKLKKQEVEENHKNEEIEQGGEE